MFYDYNWDCWLHNALADLPAGVSAGEAMKIEEKLREMIAELKVKGL